MTRTSHRSARTRKATTKAGRYTIVACVFAILGLIVALKMLPDGRAATLIAGGEAETGKVAGAAVILSGTDAGGASNGGAVKFGQTTASGGSCQVPAGQKLQDQDTSDSPETPWKRTGPEVVVYFETGKVSAEHAGYIEKGAAAWSVSPCIDARAVATCPANVNCVTSVDKNAGGGDTDGEFSGKESGGWRVGGVLTLYTDVMNSMDNANGRQVTTTHEMGHAIGLIHRIGAGTNKCAPELMMACTSDDSSPTPDDIDYQNLLVIYGTKI